MRRSSTNVRTTAEATLGAVFGVVPDALIAIGVEGVITMANPQAHELFGYEAGTLCGLVLESLVPEHAKNAHESHRKRFAAFPHARPMGLGLKLEGRRRDGSTFPVDIALSSLDVDGDRVVLAAVRDVTEQWAWAERARLEGQLQQAERLEAVGRLAGGVAHDFNNLLLVILNYSAFAIEALSAPAASEDDEARARRQAVREDVEQIRQAAERAADLTRELLLFGRGARGPAELLDVNNVVAELEGFLRGVVPESIRLTIMRGPGLLPVRVGRAELEQVVANLVLNARDAMPDGGALDVRVGNVDTDDGPAVRVTVADAGTGMPAEVAARAFEPFFTTKRRGEGTGLGLATVYGVVTHAGGRVRIDSTPGVGTTVDVDLPAAEQTRAAGSPAQEPSPTAAVGRGQVVLVAEDEEGVRAVVRRVLAGAGYLPIATASGEEALTVLEDGDVTIDLVLTDMVMPGMSGPALRDHAAACRPGVPVVFMSGYSSALEREDPGVPVLSKPFTAAALLATVEEGLRDAG
jgi:PAS domain S-box-containing protein